MPHQFMSLVYHALLCNVVHVFRIAPCLLSNYFTLSIYYLYVTAKFQSDLRYWIEGVSNTRELVVFDGNTNTFNQISKVVIASLFHLYDDS